MPDADDAEFDSVEDVIAEIKAGRLVVVTDDEDRENEGDLIGAAALLTPEKVNFMITEGRGMLCAPVSQEIAERIVARLAIEARIDDEARRGDQQRVAVGR